MRLVPLALLAACTAGGTADDGTDTGAGACWQLDTFPELTADPANGAYPDPFLSADCGSGTLTVEANGIPTYEYVDMTPNGLSAFDYTWTIPAEPTLASATSEIPLLGTIAFTVTGLPMFGPNEAEFPDPYGDPVYNDIVDSCLGHTGQGGAYHNHALLAECIVAGQDDPTGPSPLLGYAADGFPIYGPRGCLDAACEEVVTFESGWVQTGDPTTYAWDNHSYQGGSGDTVLDECNGRIGPDGAYRYHATDSFPYILGCYAGEDPASLAGQ